MNTKAVLYDLAIAGIAMGGWLIPGSLNLDLVKALSISTSLAFSGRAYYTGLCLISKDRRDEEKDGMIYDAEMELLDSSMSSLVENAIEIKALEFENRALAMMVPLVRENENLKRLLAREAPRHPEMSEEEKEEAAKQAINDAFVEKQTGSDRSEQITEEDIRKQFSESMDTTCWKAILKALNNGASKDEIVRDVLGCSDTGLGRAYFDLLKGKFM
jgi:rubrerythrin